MAVPVPRSWVAAEFVTSSIMNSDHRDAMNFNFEPPRCYAYRGTNQTFTTATWDPLQMAFELYDPYTPAAHDTATNNTRLVAPEAGIYVIFGHLNWDVNGTGQRFIDIRKNAAGLHSGGTDIEEISVPSAGSGIGTRMLVYAEAPLNAGDYIELFGQQNSGGSLAALGGQAEAFLSFRWAAKQ